MSTNFSYWRYIERTILFWAFFNNNFYTKNKGFFFFTFVIPPKPCSIMNDFLSNLSIPFPLGCLISIALIFNLHHLFARAPKTTHSNIVLIIFYVSANSWHSTVCVRFFLTYFFSPLVQCCDVFFHTSSSSTKKKDDNFSCPFYWSEQRSPPVKIPRAWLIKWNLINCTSFPHQDTLSGRRNKKQVQKQFYLIGWTFG